MMQTESQTSIRQRGLTFSARKKPTRLPPSRSNVSPAEMERWIEQVKALPDIRWEKVQAVRNSIQSDSFDVDERLNKLLEKMPDKMEDLGSNSR